MYYIVRCGWAEDCRLLFKVGCVLECVHIAASTFIPRHIDIRNNIDLTC